MRNWVGLFKLTEEAGEVLQVIGKLHVKPNGDHWSGDLVPMIEDELGDLLAAVAYVIDHNNLNFDKISERVHQKRQLYEKWILS